MINLQDSLIKNRETMMKEYISPEMEILMVLSDSAILSVSVAEPVLEDLTVSDGEW